MAKQRLALLVLAAALAVVPAALSFAQAKTDIVPPPGAAAFKPSEYWLGIVTEPVPEALRSHLQLPENQGLLVEQVAPESPAAAAAIQRHDIVLKAAGKPLSQVGDLIAAVDASKGEKMELELLRGGKKMKLAVTPAKRPEGAIPGLRVPTPAEAFGKWIEQFRAGDPRHRDYSLFFLRPGVVVARPGKLPDLPSNVTIAITKQGDQPAKIVVARGKEKWEATENNLDAIPAELRPHVEAMLRNPTWHGALMADPEAFTPPAPPGQRLLKPDARKSLEKQLAEMNRQLEELRKAVEELKKPASAKPEGGGKK